MLRPTTLCILTILALGVRAEEKPPRDTVPLTPPVAKRQPHSSTLHGETREDPYFWLREKTNPDTIRYLEAENAFTQSAMAPHEALHAKLYKEILGRIKQTDLSVPYRQRGFLYYTRFEDGKQYAIRCRKPGSLDAAEQILVDGNKLAEGKKFAQVGASTVSDDNFKLAYSVDFTGFREFHLYLKDLTTGKLVSETPVAKTSNAVWAADNRTLFYTTEDKAKRAHKVWRHALGGQPELVLEEKDELFRMGVTRSRDQKLIFISSSSSDATEVRYLPADKPNSAPVVILPREPMHEYSAEHRDGRLYLRTNKDAKNYRIVTAPMNDPAPKNWKEVVPHRPKVLLAGLLMFADYFVVLEHESGIPQVAVHNFAKGDSYRVTFPEPVYSVAPDANPEFDSKVLRFRYQSMVTPDSVYDYDLVTRERKLLKQTEVVGGYDASKYTSERIEATAPDGVRVPISLVYKKGHKRDGTAPILLSGYGAYGFSIPTTFSSSSLSLLDRGVVVAIAHVRGGKDLGQHWHDDGKMLQKKNSFTDFVVCADHLIAEKYGARNRMAIRGGSAGGLLMGAVINLRPDLCKAAVLDVPFVDVINTMLDTTLPLTVGEFLEWGNPQLPTEYEYIKSYCPYTNLKAGNYPAILVTTSLNDSQVMYHEPTKYVAKLRTLKTDKNLLLLKCNMAGGHGGSSGRFDALKELAFTYAFMLAQMGIDS